MLGQTPLGHCSVSLIWSEGGSQSGDGVTATEPSGSRQSVGTWYAREFSSPFPGQLSTWRITGRLSSLACAFTSHAGVSSFFLPPQHERIYRGGLETSKV